jgi:hypothetical protein
MTERSRKNLLLLLILIFAFSYRFLLMTWDTFPPGADIGLHESIINSIMPGHTTFLWNYYHMGGGISITNPGYHIFVAFVILMTGMPDYLAQSIVVSFFSTLIVLAAFLITRSVWNESASFIVAFLVAISAADIEMLMWAGYPNVITLMLIPLIFYLYLQRPRFSIGAFLLVTSLLAGAIFLTHTFSALMFIAITVSTVFLALIFSKRIGLPKRHFIPWLLPIIIGALLVSPYLLQLAPLYSGPEGTVTGEVSAIRSALLSTRLVPVELVILSVIPVLLFFVFSKAYKGKLLTVPAFLFAMWILVPAFLTQSYLIGIYLDYNRFWYFLILPFIVFVALSIDHGSRFFSRVIDYLISLIRSGAIQIELNYAKTPKIVSRLTPRLTSRNIYSALVLGFLIFSFVYLPIFLYPSVGIDSANFYQVMTDPRYAAVQWIKNNTPIGSVCVTDAEYGWWLSGFAERPTLSAVDPQFLTVAREFEPAKMAKSMLDTDYIIDNGLIQVRDDGGYIGRHNPIFLAKINNTYFPYPFFHLNDSEVTVLCRKDNIPQMFDLSQVPVRNMYMQNDSNHASIFIIKGNQLFNFTEQITVYRGVRFVDVSVTLQSGVAGVSLDWLRFILHTKGISLQVENTTALVDNNMRVIGQLIFTAGQPETRVYTSENPSSLELLYNLGGKFEAEMQFFVGVYQYRSNPNLTEKAQADYIQNLIANNTKSYLNKVSDLPLDIFDYRVSIIDWNISYILLRDPESIPRFANDPLFSLVFINKDVAVLMVKRSFNQTGTLLQP